MGKSHELYFQGKAPIWPFLIGSIALALIQAPITPPYLL